MPYLLILLSLLIGSLTAGDDVLHIKTGAKVEGRIVAEGVDDYAVITDGKFKRIPKGNVDKVERGKDEPQPAKSPGPCRTPGWEQIVAQIAQQQWAADLREIPATVVTQGPLRNVPYRSFQCGKGEIELNIYGDPDAPVAVEIGLYKSRVAKADSQKLCREFVASLLSHKTDKAIRGILDADGDLVIRDSVTFEVTPPAAKDAYGGWWVSLYNESALDGAERAMKNSRPSASHASKQRRRSRQSRMQTTTSGSRTTSHALDPYPRPSLQPAAPSTFAATTERTGHTCVLILGVSEPRERGPTPPRPFAFSPLAPNTLTAAKPPVGGTFSRSIGATPL